MNVERLTRSLSLLEKPPSLPIIRRGEELGRRRLIFDMGQWVGCNASDCPTACCAVGLHALNYPEDGLSVEYGTLYFDCWLNFEAVEHFYDLRDLFALRRRANNEPDCPVSLSYPVSLSMALFGPDHYVVPAIGSGLRYKITRKQVADRLKLTLDVANSSVWQPTRPLFFLDDDTERKWIVASPCI